MSSKHFCLKWNSFQSSILNAFESLQNSEDLADVTLTCEGINLKAHKFILSACSPYFRTVFKENPCPHPIVILKDVLYTDLIAIINFMYHGEVMVTEDQLASFLNTAKLLQVSGLNSNEPSKKNPSTPKRVKPLPASENFETLNKKPKKNKTTNSNINEVINAIKEAEKSTNSELIETNRIKTETVEDEQFCPDVNENVEIVTEKMEQQASILEAALDAKRSSILERSLLSSQSGKSPSYVPYTIEGINIMQINQDMQKHQFIPRKPPDTELEKRLLKSRASESSSPIAYDRPSELLQQSLQVEGESYDSCDAVQDISMGDSAPVRPVEAQPHHSSQWGNCPHCGKAYSNQSALKYHVRLVHSDLTNMYCCHLCPEAFDFREAYKKHMAEAHSIRN